MSGDLHLSITIWSGKVRVQVTKATSIYILRFHNSSKPVRQLRQYRLRQSLPINARNIAIANSITRNEDIILLLIRLSRRGADAHMRHIPGQHELVLARRLDELLEIGAGEGSRKLLGDHLLAVLWRQLCEFLCERRARREDGSAGWDGVHDVHDGAGGRAVLLEEGGDGRAG